VAPPPAAVSSSLKNLVTSAIGAAGSEETPKPSSTSPAAGEASQLVLCFLCWAHRGESAIAFPHIELTTASCATSISCHATLFTVCLPLMETTTTTTTTIIVSCPCFVFLCGSVVQLNPNLRDLHFKFSHI